MMKSRQRGALGTVAMLVGILILLVGAVACTRVSNEEKETLADERARSLRERITQVTLAQEEERRRDVSHWSCMTTWAPP